MYKDGFVLSDSKEFRNYEDKKNKKFLEELSKGFVPTELRSKYKDGLKVAIEDKRSKNFIEKPKKTFFKGQGMSLGNTSTNTKSMNTNKELGEIKLIPGEEVYDLQLRFSDGKKKVVQVNKSTKMCEIKHLIVDMLKSANIKICTSFPVKNVTNSKDTLLVLDLLDSSVNVSFN